MFRIREFNRFVIFALSIAALSALGTQAQDTKKGSDEDIKKAREEVKQLRTDLDKIEDQYTDAERKLRRATDRLAELEGRPRLDSRGRFGGGFGGFGGPGGPGRGGPDRPKSDPSKGDGQKGDGQKGDGQKGDTRRGDAPKGDAPKGDSRRGDAPRQPEPPARPKTETQPPANDLDKRIERLMKEIEDLRKDLKKNPPSKD